MTTEKKYRSQEYTRIRDDEWGPSENAENVGVSLRINKKGRRGKKKGKKKKKKKAGVSNHHA